MRPIRESIKDAGAILAEAAMDVINLVGEVQEEVKEHRRKRALGLYSLDIETQDNDDNQPNDSQSQ